MLKQILTFLLFGCFTTLSLTAQIQVKPSSCLRKQTQKGKYFEWECGKLAGVVDCNVKLEYDDRAKLFLSSTGGKPYTGTCETCFENGIRERKISFVNGKEVGTDTTKYFSGCPMVIRHHVDGYENGRWTYFYDTTNMVAWEMDFLLGQKHGKHIYYNKKGDTTLLETYKYDQLNGVKRIFYSTGKVHREIHYLKGQLDGSFTVFNKEEKVIEKLNYSEGKKNGVQSFYYDDGTLLKTETWTDEIKNGPFITYYYQGFIQVSENWKKGIKHGVFEEYFNNRRLKLKSIYKKGELIEEHEFNEKGKEIRTFPEIVKEPSENEDDEIELEPTEKKKNKKKKEKEEE